MSISREEILKREDGSRVKITVIFCTSRHVSPYSFHVQTCAKGKRTWLGVTDVNCHKYRALSMDDRRLKEFSDNLDVASRWEVDKVMNDLWNEMHPHTPGMFKV